MSKWLFMVFQLFPFLLFSEEEGWLGQVRFSFPEHYRALWEMVILFCRSTWIKWGHVSILIDYLSLLHVQTICYIAAININKMPLKNVAEIWIAAVMCLKGKNQHQLLFISFQIITRILSSLRSNVTCDSDHYDCVFPLHCLLWKTPCPLCARWEC